MLSSDLVKFPDLASGRFVERAAETFTLAGKKQHAQNPQSYLANAAVVFPTDDVFPDAFKRRKAVASLTL